MHSRAGRHWKSFVTLSWYAIPLARRRLPDHPKEQGGKRDLRSLEHFRLSGRLAGATPMPCSILCSDSSAPWCASASRRCSAITTSWVGRRGKQKVRARAARGLGRCSLAVHKKLEIPLPAHSRCAHIRFDNGDRHLIMGGNNHRAQTALTSVGQVRAFCAGVGEVVRFEDTDLNAPASRRQLGHCCAGER
jgi:hypothetical protein